jgi:hypothetical protein
MSNKAAGMEGKPPKEELSTTKDELESARARIAELEDRLRQGSLKVEVRQTDKQEESPAPISGIIKDQLVLIGFLIFFVGIISTHTYYASFGIKYQFLDLPTFHIIYHGLLILIDAPYLIIPYLVAVVWLGLDSYTKVKRWRKLAQLRGVLTYILVIPLLAISFPLARHAGEKLADVDLHENSSQLPKIVNLQLSSGEKYGMADQYRLLVVDSTYTVIFKPLDPGDNSTLPNIKRFSKSQINVIETIRP